MVNTRIFLAIAFLIFQREVRETSSKPKCDSFSTTGTSLRLAINSRKNETGDWVTTFSAWKDSKVPSNNITLDVTHQVIECEGKQIVYINGVVNAEYDNQSLLFHPNCGKNAAISNDGRTVRKINLNDASNGVVFTNRPLKNNELFEVKLDKKDTKFQYSLGFGVTVKPPSGFSYLDKIDYLKSGSWMYYHNHAYKDAAISLKNYGRSLNELVVGDRVGVLRNNYGTLHYFINGADQGPAASNIPYPIYGVFELYFNAIQGTIVESSNP